MLTAGNVLPPVGSLTYVEGQVTFAISPLTRGISLARKILLADDSVTAQNMGRKILADAGYEVIAVNNGSAALKKIAELKPDLVILDVYMPGYSGLEVCQRLKESHETARIPVLLTVGKLEPFKPEEAQRVRAEGYIVKPFEASELLSALSKLEDKIVPRAEPSKPGRFARAVAAAEESGPSEASDSDNGWRSRIGFPHKKKGTEERPVETTSTYNPVNRDLRTVVEKPEEKIQGKERHQEEPAGQSSVTLSALAAAGLPKDVTAEEVAAITAAAAQMQMASAAFKEEYQPSGEAGVAGENKTESKTPAPKVQGEAEIPLNAPLSALETKATLQTSTEENKPQQEVVSEPVAEKIYKRRKTDFLPEQPEQPQDIPVTMAATAEFAETAIPGASRWTAVAVALESEEAALSLDHEMQKARATSEPNFTAVAVMTEENPETEHLSAPAEPVVEARVEAISNPEPVAIPEPEAEPMRSEVVEAVAQPIAQSEPSANASYGGAQMETVSEDSAAPIPQAETTVDSTPPEHAPSEVSPVTATREAEPNQSIADELEGPTVLANPAFANPSAEMASAALDAMESQETQESEPAPIVEAVEAVDSNAAFESAPNDEPAPKMDNEAVKSSAAAWASWRQIRDTSKSPDAVQNHPREFDAPELPPSEAAMAAAAGAEQILQAASTQPSRNPADVASIVDSVLADLRPKLMEEISRKMSEKK